jgi:predicted transcriptional regulator
MTDAPDFGDPDINAVHAAALRLLLEHQISIGDQQIAESTGLDVHTVRAALMFLGGEYLNIEPFPDGSVTVHGDDQSL